MSPIVSEEEYLAHYGILRRSGRYPWGSGGTESKRNKSYLDYIAQHKREGMNETEIAKMYGMTRNQLTAAKTIARDQQRQERILTAERLKEKGYSNVAIGEKMGINESSVRALLAPGSKDKADALQTTSNMLKDQVGEDGMLDVGAGVENHLGVTRTRLDTAIAVLQEQGYETHTIYIPQVNQPGQFTNMKVLVAPGITKSYVNQNRADIKLINNYSEDTGRSFLGVAEPISLNSKRIAVNYAEDGGSKADGVIYLRPGLDDLSLGGKNYGQVRVAVDGTHFLKGMAVYKDDLPNGVDVLFNTNKSNKVPLMSNDPKVDQVFKPMKRDKDGNVDWDNPFGSIIRQINGPDGKITSAMNIVGSPLKEGSGVEGAWDDWARNLPSQFLSKQDPKLAKAQLDITYNRRAKEFAEINSLTNPVVRRDLLQKFADETDSAAVHLQAANLPRQATKVLLPVPSMKPNEVYAPGFNNGESIALVRFPHGGTFEIPILKVNNRNPEAKKTLGSAALDAVGIHHSVAERLSGADFDGDTVLAIPNNKGLVKNRPALEGLKKFDPMGYKLPADSPIPRMTKAGKGLEMGKVSNLITDMTLRGANDDEMAAAIRHSMVVIDAEKHGLNYKQSEKDNNILHLKKKYQSIPGKSGIGASTIISRASSPHYIKERRLRKPSEGGPIDPLTGKKVYVDTGKTKAERKRVTDRVTGERKYVDTGKRVDVQEVVKRLSVEDDAHTISSGLMIEELYANHSNKLKAMANTARKESLTAKPTPQSKSAKRVYVNEVASLDKKLDLAKRNAPLERHAQAQANSTVSLKRQANPDMDDETIKKLRTQAINEARVRTGAAKTRIKLTQEEWNAIQAGAISTSKLEEILRHADGESVVQYALPKHTPKLTNSMVVRAQQMLASGATQAEVADALGVGLTTLKVGLND